MQPVIMAISGLRYSMPMRSRYSRLMEYLTPLPLLHSAIIFLNVAVPKIRWYSINVSAGRNLAVVIEAASRNFRLKSMGRDPLEQLSARIMEDNRPVKKS